MKRYGGRGRVPRGMYWSLESGAFFQVPMDDVALPGEPGEQYVRIPAPIVMVVGPMMGLAFVFFLPLVGIIGLGISLVFRLVQFAQWGFSSAVRAALRQGKKQQPDIPNLPENPTREDVEVWLQNLDRGVKR